MDVTADVTVQYALSLMVVGWIFGFVFGWVMRAYPAKYAASLLLLAAITALSLLFLL